MKWIKWLVAFMICSPAFAAAETVQRTCTFDYYIQTTAAGVKRGNVFWAVTVARKKRAGRVIVDGSGDYSARARVFDSGGSEYVFKTDASTETMTIGPTGDALWDIQFKNGDTLVYTGQCGEAQVNN